MHPRRLLCLATASVACAFALFAADFWKTKDSSQWSSEEIDKVLNDSPWARAKTVQPQQSQTGRRGGGGGMGRRGGGFGYPGAGGGGGYPGGSRNDGDGSQTGQSAGPMNLTIRWDSAAPVEQALMRRGAGDAKELKAVTDASEKYYVISVQGFRLPRPRSRDNDSDDQSTNNSDSDDDRSARGRNGNSDYLRNQLLDAAQLAPKGKSSVYAQDVQIDGDGSGGVRFLFPRTNSIGAGDKEVDFILDLRRMKVEEKFHLSDMQYEGKLAL